MSGGLFHGIQLWVNLPSKDKWVAPRYQDIRGGPGGAVSSPDGGALVRVIAGEVDGHAGPGVTHTPMAMAHVTVSPGARVTLPWNRDHNALVYVLAGDGSAGTEAARRASVSWRCSVPATPSSSRPATARNHVAPLDVLVLGGRPIGEPVVTYGPFVMNTRAEIVQALDDFQHGKLGTIPADHIG